jgi:hypothetical protein
MVPRQPFEDYRDRCLDPLEVRAPAMPRDMVIGLTGVAGSDNKASCMGLVVRKIEHQHLFSYYWVQDVMRQKAIDASAAGKDPKIHKESDTIDGASIPSRLIMRDDSFAFFDSLTLADTEAKFAEDDEKFRIHDRTERGVADSVVSAHHSIETGGCLIL